MNSSSVLDTPQKIIAAAVRSVGYDPVDSLVFLPVSDAGGRAVVRVDLPRRLERAPLADRDVASWARQAAGALFRVEGVSRAAFVLFPGARLGPGASGDRASLPYFAAALALGRALDQGGVELVLPLWRTLDAWGAYCCDVPGCPLRGPRDIEELSAAFTRGRSSAPSFAVRATVAPASSRERAAVGRRLLGLRARPVAIDAALAAWRRATRPGGLAPSKRFDDIAAVLRAFEEPEPCETLLHWSAFGGAALEELADRRASLARDGRSASVSGVLGLSAAQGAFDLDRALDAAVVLRGLAAFADAAARAPALAALAWCEWATGQSSLAHAHATAALELEPEHELADDIVALTSSSVVPAWLAGIPWLAPGEREATAGAARGRPDSASDHGDDDRIAA